MDDHLFSMLANHLFKHQTTRNMDCQPGDGQLIFLRILLGRVRVDIFTLSLPRMPMCINNPRGRIVYRYLRLCISLLSISFPFIKEWIFSIKRASHYISSHWLIIWPVLLYTVCDDVHNLWFKEILTQKCNLFFIHGYPTDTAAPVQENRLH